MNERYSEQDFTVAIEAQKRWELRNQAIRDAGVNNPATWEEREIRADIDRERERVFKALLLII